MNLNTATQPLVERAEHEARSLRIESHRLEEGGHILDFGCRTVGGIEAGLLLAKICLGNLAAVELAPADRGIWPSPIVMVSTDDPCNACMGSQYAGWKLASDSFFAMGSGPMRAKRGNEAVLDAHLGADVHVRACLHAPYLASYSRARCRLTGTHEHACSV